MNTNLDIIETLSNLIDDMNRLTEEANALIIKVHRDKYDISDVIADYTTIVNQMHSYMDSAQIAIKKQDKCDNMCSSLFNQFTIKVYKVKSLSDELLDAIEEYQTYNNKEL